MTEQTERQTLNSCGAGYISRNLKISENTVTSDLKKTPAEINPYFIRCLNNSFLSEAEVEIRTDAEADEPRSYVGNKGNQRRTWYAVERNTGIIPAWHDGRRTDGSWARLTEKPSVFLIKYFHADNWRSYSKHIPSHKHIIGKSGTWGTERKNPNFRTHIRRLSRKTICFSKKEDVHDNVIGMYINRYYFEKNKF